MFTFIAATIHHATLLLTFRHPGTGLPALGSPTLYPLVALMFCLATLRGAMVADEAIGILIVLLTQIFVAGLALWFCRKLQQPRLFSPWVILQLTQDALLVALYLALDTPPGSLRIAIDLWCVAAFLKLFWAQDNDPKHP